MATPIDPEPSPPPQHVPQREQSAPPSASPGSSKTRRRWPWVLGGIGCLSLIALCVVGIIFFVKVSGAVDEAKARVKHLQATGADKLIGSWKRDGSDPTVQSFKTDGSFTVKSFGKATDGTRLEFSTDGTYRVESDNLYMTFTDIHLLTAYQYAAQIESMAKEQARKQMKFGKEQQGKIAWVDRDTFGITEGEKVNVWKRQ